MDAPASPPMLTAQDVYRVFVRDYFASRMRALGFVGSGNEYTLPDPGCWIRVGLQKSVHSTAECVMFTMNVCVVNKNAWDILRAQRPHLPRQPRSAHLASEPVWQIRVGHLLPTREDTWWDLHDGVDLPVFAETLANLIRGHVLPVIGAEAAARARG